MKEKYGEQDEEERQMRMALTGSKHVQGFDIQKHSQHKLGGLIDKRENDGKQEQEPEEEKQESPEEEAQE